MLLGAGEACLSTEAFSCCMKGLSNGLIFGEPLGEPVVEPAQHVNRESYKLTELKNYV